MFAVVRPGWSWHNNTTRITHAELEVVEVDLATLEPAHTRALTVPENDKALEGKNTRTEIDAFKKLCDRHAQNERDTDAKREAEDKEAQRGARDNALMRAANVALVEKMERIETQLAEANATIAALSSSRAAPAKPLRSAQPPAPEGTT